LNGGAIAGIVIGSVGGLLLLCILCLLLIFCMRRDQKDRAPPAAVGKYDTQTDASQMGASNIEMQNAEPSVASGETETA